VSNVHNKIGLSVRKYSDATKLGRFFEKNKESRRIFHSNTIPPPKNTPFVPFVAACGGKPFSCYLYSMPSPIHIAAKADARFGAKDK
jgi:hypothetical protein